LVTGSCSTRSRNFMTSDNRWSRSLSQVPASCILGTLGETREETFQHAKEVGSHLIAGRRWGSSVRQSVGANCLSELRPATDPLFSPGRVSLRGVALYDGSARRSSGIGGNSGLIVVTSNGEGGGVPVAYKAD
jgi:hypothetical protein